MNPLPTAASTCKTTTTTTTPSAASFATNSLTFYPTYAYAVSPTFSKWCKLTAHDIHTNLTDRRGHDGLRHLWFYLNHPIQYVDITAPIVAIEPLGANDKFALLTLDDGSGAVIGVKITRLLEGSSSGSSSTIHHEKRSDACRSGHAAEDKDADEDEQQQEQLSKVDCPSNTTVANVNIHVPRLGSNTRFTVTVDTTPLDIGTIVRCKGHISTWWNTRQLELLRISIIKNTRREVQSWRELSRFKQHVLAKPWVLRARQLRMLELGWREEQERETNARTRWSEYQRRKKEREEKAETAYEVVRREQEAKMNEGALI